MGASVNHIVAQLNRHEGFRSKPYQCTSGVWTWGYGFTETTEDEADMVLRLKVLELRHALYDRICHLTPARQDVVLNMSYNLGLAGLGKFSRMWSAIRDGNYDLAATEMLNSKWARQVGNRAIELAEQMRRG
jgi:lysozyme